jgi:acyl carrier protein
MAGSPEALREDTRQRLEKIVVDHLGVAARDVGPDVLLLGDARRNADKPNLGADSLDIVELCMAVEDEFGVELPDDEIEKLNGATFGELVDFVQTKRAERQL